jgi:hypothetical protein
MPRSLSVTQLGCGRMEGPKVELGKIWAITFVGLAYQGKKDIVFRFIIEYSSLRDFGP